MRWLAKLFPPGPAAADPAPEGDTWSAGDLAECLHPGPWVHIACGGQIVGPQKGEVYRVAFTGIGPAAPWEMREVRTYLAFGRFNMALFPAALFRKVVPRADEQEAADPAFVEELRRRSEPVL